VSGQALILSRDDIMMLSHERRRYIVVDILVELELHEVRTRGRMRSCASLAP